MSDLLPRVARGDADAIEACLSRYADVVWRLARRYLDRAEGEVEDAVQEVFVELWLAAGRYDPAKGSEAAFVATLAHRRLIDVQRRVSARRRMHIRATQEAIPSLVAAQSASSSGVQAVGDAAEAFDQLPEEERRALWLALFRGMSQQEISTATDAPIGTVKSRLRRGMIRLTERLGAVSTGNALKEVGP